MVLTDSGCAGYLHELHYARVAHKPYSVGDVDDPLVGITVCAYHDDEEIAKLQKRVFYKNLDHELQLQYGDDKIDFEEMKNRVVKMFSELFRGSGKGIGNWPNSTAYYAVDVIFDSQGIDETEIKFVPQPKLVEVNFLGDWHGAANAVDDISVYHQWCHDVVSTLATNELPLDRLIKL